MAGMKNRASMVADFEEALRDYEERLANIIRRGVRRGDEKVNPRSKSVIRAHAARERVKELYREATLWVK